MTPARLALLLLLAGSIINKAGLGLASYVEAFGATILPALIATAVAWRIPKEQRNDLAAYAPACITFMVIVGVTIAGNWYGAAHATK
jgi:amino acid permease